MAYQEDKYLSERLPEFKGATIADAVPGYWEDMTDKFCNAEFYRTLRTNPAYGFFEYPITHYCPDMFLPNILGNFFYSRTFLCENINAPMREIVVSGTEDHGFLFDGAIDAVNVGRRGYEALGVGERLIHVVAKGPHRFFAKESYPYIHQMIKEL